MLEEPPVLDRDHRLGQPGRHLLESEVVAVAVAEARERDALAVEQRDLRVALAGSRPLEVGENRGSRTSRAPPPPASGRTGRSAASAGSGARACSPPRAAPAPAAARRSWPWPNLSSVGRGRARPLPADDLEIDHRGVDQDLAAVLEVDRDPLADHRLAPGRDPSPAGSDGARAHPAREGCSSTVARALVAKRRAYYGVLKLDRNPGAPCGRRAALARAVTPAPAWR